MKAAFTVDGTPYLMTKESDKVVVQLFRVNGLKKPELVATFPTWKKQDWTVDDISDTSKAKVAIAVEALRRLANSATVGFVIGD